MLVFHHSVPHSVYRHAARFNLCKANENFYDNVDRPIAIGANFCKRFVTMVVAADRLPRSISLLGKERNLIAEPERTSLAG